MYDVTIYTDGSSKTSVNAGGYSCMLVCNGQWKVIARGKDFIDNDRAEMLAVLMGLRELTMPCNVTIISDSTYVVNTINQWIFTWAKNKWKNSKNKVISNAEIIVQIFNLMQMHNVKAKWIKAHTNKKGIKYLGNACVDMMAQYAAVNLA